MRIVIRTISSYGNNYRSSNMFKRSSKIKQVLSPGSTLQSELKKNVESEIIKPMKEATVKRTGKLREGNEVVEGGGSGGGGKSIASVTIQNLVEYGPHVEFGTYKMDAQAFFYPTIKTKGPGLMTKMAQSVIKQTQA